MCTTEQLAILHHEAGHAVVGHSAGITITKIAVDKSSISWTGAAYPDFDEWETYNHSQRAKYYLAGGESELYCNSTNNILFTGQSDDGKAKACILLLLDFPDMTTLLSVEQLDEYHSKYEELRNLVIECLTNNWNVVENIVGELKKTDELEGEKLTEILSTVQ